MSDKERDELLAAYFAGQWMIGQLLSGARDIKASDCWDTGQAMLEVVKESRKM